MSKVLITGSEGFIGRNLRARLAEEPGIEALLFDRNDPPERLDERLESAEFVFHLAGVNRPRDPGEFRTGNVEFTRLLIRKLAARGEAVPVLFASSIQATKDNPYGRSKKEAEDILLEYRARRDARVYIYRLPNVFGKWSRPDYNSVVATFCHRIARKLEIEISDPDGEIELLYIDDAIDEFLSALRGEREPGVVNRTLPTRRVTLRELARRIYRLNDFRTTLRPPDFSDPLNRRLQATFLSFLEPDRLAIALPEKKDGRGSLVEFVKSETGGQIFFSRTRPGITRGNHYHHTKAEKFWVLNGRGVIRLKPLLGGETTEFKVSGKDHTVIDIPPGWTHSIENVSNEELLVLFWSSEVFAPDRPDTFRREIKP